MRRASAVETAVVQDMRRLLRSDPNWSTDARANITTDMRYRIATRPSARQWYLRQRCSAMLLLLSAAIPEDMDIEQMLRDRGFQPTDPDALDIPQALRIQLANGYTLSSGWIDADDPDALPAGDYFSVLNAAGQQVFYLDAADLFSEPEKGRLKLYEMVQACLGLGVTNDTSDPVKTGMPKPV